MKQLDSIFEKRVMSSDKNKDEYRRFLEKLRIEIGDFLREAERAEVIRFSARKARSQSVKVRDLLKTYRLVSLKQDKKINKEKYKGTKPEINCNEEIYRNINV